MKLSCPKCQSHPPLKAKQLRDKLIAYGCDHCAGSYLPAKNYLPWASSEGESQAVNSA